MPIYEFTCDKCGHDFEEITNSDTSRACPYCGSTETRKMMSTSARRPRGGEDYSAPSSGGCGGCSGGNCASCGH